MAPFNGKHDVLGETPGQAEHKTLQVIYPGEAMLPSHPVFGKGLGIRAGAHILFHGELNV